MKKGNNLTQEIDKKIQSYAMAALFGGILQVFFGFGFGFVNLAIFLITLVTSITALVKNRGGSTKVVIFSCIGLGLVFTAFILRFILSKAPIDYLLTTFLK